MSCCKKEVFLAFVLAILGLQINLSSNTQQKPNIIFILADDMGFNDVGFHGSSQIPTPNLDALAYSGIVLHRYYVTPICTPSRAALMTGNTQFILVGMQHTVIYAAEPRGLSLNEKLMPQYLNEHGYSSHIAGKWHLGHYKKVYTPLYRGFKSHVGCLTGHQDYYDHTAVDKNVRALDMRNGLDVAYNLTGKYSTDIITDEAVRVIRQRNTSVPLFMYVPQVAVHSGNLYDPLQAPQEALKRVSYISDPKRRKYAAIMVKLEDSVGTIVEELEKQNMLSNSIIIFSTDNGGAAGGFNLNHASNWPLRGVKNTLWEGGVRGAGFIWSRMLHKTQRVSIQTMHITDWLPTLMTAIGAPIDPEALEVDGVSMWNELSSGEESKRKKILHNIDNIWQSASLTDGEWKIHNGTNYNGQWDGWYGPSGIIRDENSYDLTAVLNSQAGRALSSMKMMPTQGKIIQLRKSASVNCSRNEIYKGQGSTCKPNEKPCLFNTRYDPCEQVNLTKQYPDILERLLSELKAEEATAVEPRNKALDKRADPKFWNNTWMNFGDYLHLPKMNKKNKR